MTRSLREQSQGLCLPLHGVYPSQLVTQSRTSVFMAQGATNHISKNKNKSLEAAKEGGEEPLARFAFCREWLSPSLCRHAFAFPCVCLFTSESSRSTRWGKASAAGSLHSKPSLHFFTSHCGTFQARPSAGNGNQTNLQHFQFSYSHFLLCFRSVSR